MHVGTVPSIFSVIGTRYQKRGEKKNWCFVTDAMLECELSSKHIAYQGTDVTAIPNRRDLVLWLMMDYAGEKDL